MSNIPPIATLFSLHGKTALVTGGSRGIGLHTATAFLLAGCSLVIINARKSSGEEGIDAAVSKLNSLPGIKGRAVGMPGSNAVVEEIAKLVEQTRTLTGGKLDILVANAGATWGGGFEETPDWSSSKILDLNVRGVFNMVRLYLHPPS